MPYIPEEKIRKICEEINGTYGLYISLPERGEKMTISADTRFNSASTIKIPLLALLLKDFEDGRLDPNKPEPIWEGNRVGGSGILNSLSDHYLLPLYDYAVLMMIVSDNAATTQTIDAVGIDRANGFFAENGWMDTHLAGKLQRRKPLLPNGEEDFNQTSAADLGDMMEKILAGKMISKQVSDQMMQIMAAQQLGVFCQSLPLRRVPDTRQPLPPVPADRVLMCHKGGSLEGKVLHDAAILLLPNGEKAVLVMMTATPDNDITRTVISKVSRALYDSLIAL